MQAGGAKEIQITRFYEGSSIINPQGKSPTCLPPLAALRVYFQDALGSPQRSEWNQRCGTVYQILNEFKNKVIKLLSPDGQIVADCLEHGMSVTEATHMVNEYRQSVNEVHVGRSAVYSSSLRMKPVVTPLVRQKQGNADQDSAWAIARNGHAQQFATRLGIWSGNDGACPPYLDKAQLTPIEITQVVV
ncbi:hypothetical protein H257_07850 [Aphanomyces astaci]|uniref:Uncharacterized protein n=1 Tax=Aphanomyces astaci TaxID=112090 RepID=W4GJE4_APHAT|nr:hypothetical protein H257_07850 [Aphanomyces astaci]ETV79114.1 hypothetical protein H257_07850 [Aphanomyces astaci]|eukprot:XP_009831833.1 hypothetical protein H257_07850 [Aphanomyces astaci]